MTVRLHERGIQALVLDIEGTTTPIAFVSHVLFPFARARLRSYLHDHLEATDTIESIRGLRAEWAEDVARGNTPPDWPDESAVSLEGMAAYVEWLMDRDRKSPALKRLQGAIWETGYRAGALKGEVFDDVRPALERWVDGGVELAIYSSGSELAQRLLFSTTSAGDLTPFISRFFDTAIGPKTSADSYRRIAQSMQCPIERMLFVSDVAQELDAARSSGCLVVLCIRPGNPGIPNTPETMIPPVVDTPVVRGFDEIVL